MSYYFKNIYTIYIDILNKSLYHISGNVKEWCVLNLKNNSYGVCGGSWALNGEYQKSDYLIKIEKSKAKTNIGFRLIYTPKE